MQFYDLENEKNKEQFNRELSALIKLRQHQNLVAFKGVSFKNNFLCIVNEFCGGGTLFHLLQKQQNKTISLLTKLKFAKDIASGMSYLHSLTPAMIHRDLKSLKFYNQLQYLTIKSILLESEFKQEDQDPNRIKLKITDFGLAKQFDMQMTGFTGTILYMAPEMLKGLPYTTSVDVYSFAIVLWEIFSRQMPYQNNQLKSFQLQQAVIQNNLRPDISLIKLDAKTDKENLIINDIKVLIIQCWDATPEKRPTFQIILQEIKALYNKLIES